MYKIKIKLFLSLILLPFLNANAQNGYKEPISFKLKNGMTIIISENNKSEKTFSSFTLNQGAFPNKKDGVMELLNAVLNEGVAKSNCMSFKDQSGKLTSDVADFDSDLIAFASNIENAMINQSTFNLAKAKLLASLKLHDYDYDQAVNENTINALSLSDVQMFYNTITPDKTYLTIAGQISVNEAKNCAKRAFSNWNKADNNTTSTIAE